MLFIFDGTRSILPSLNRCFLELDMCLVYTFDWRCMAVISSCREMYD